MVGFAWPLTWHCSLKGVQAVAEVDLPKFANLSDANSTSLQRLLVLEGLQDPGNLVHTLTHHLFICLYA